MSDDVQPKTPAVRGPRRFTTALRLAALAPLAGVILFGANASSGSAASASISSLQAKAAQLASEIAAAENQANADGEQIDAAKYHLGQVEAKIQATNAAIASDRQQVSANQQVLQTDAVNAYVDDGESTSTDSLFSTDAKTVATTELYTSVAAGNLSAAVDNLTTSVNQLNVESAALANQKTSAVADVNAANSAQAQANADAANLQGLYNETKGQLAAAFRQAQAAQAAAQAAATRAALAAAAAAQAQAAAGAGTGTSSGGGGTPSQPVTPPPSSGVGGAAVAAAESFLGVPYVWGGASRSGVDCSGLVMLAYQEVGVSLPHYSGAQYADSTPVPVSDLEPGDLLFYGYEGDEHVAMYIGGGMMIEAPHTGAVVHITPIRLGYGFWGAGRPY